MRSVRGSTTDIFFLIIRRAQRSILSPYTTLFRSHTHTHTHTHTHKSHYVVFKSFKTFYFTMRPHVCMCVYGLCVCVCVCVCVCEDSHCGCVYGLCVCVCEVSHRGCVY